MYFEFIFPGHIAIHCDRASSQTHYSIHSGKTDGRFVDLVALATSWSNPTVKSISSEEDPSRRSPDSAAFLLSRSSGLASNGVVAGMFLAAYVALEWVSSIHEYKGLPVTP